MVKYEGPAGRGALRVNELESSLCGEFGVGWRRSLCLLRLTWNSWGQFHFNGLPSSERGLNIWSPPLCSLASLPPLHRVFSPSNPPHSRHFFPSPFSLSACTPLHTFLFLLPPPPPCCSSLSLSEPEEWGWQVHGWEGGEKKGKKSKEKEATENRGRDQNEGLWKMWCRLDYTIQRD